MKEIENTREPSGGFMIPRIFAEITSALSDDDAGRILKGLIYEFWGCGEKAAVSESPVVNAVYNSIVQAAKEIDSNYHAQRSQKRDAGRKSAEARRQKTDSSPTEFNAVEKCSNGVQLNKSKVNEKEKENKSNESNASEKKAVTPPSAVLTDEQRNLLVDKYGESAVDAYEKRFERWKASKKAFNGNAGATLAKWMEEDRVEMKSGSGSSFTAEMVERCVAERYRRLADSG